MFTELVRKSKSIDKISNMFDISPTLHDSVCGPWLPHLETILSWISRACQLHFPSCPIPLLSCLEKLAILSWLSTTPPPDRPAKLTDHT